MQAKQRWLAGAHLLTVSTSLCSSVKKAASCGSSLELLFGLLFSSVTEAAWLQSFQDSFRARCLVSNSFQAWILVCIDGWCMPGANRAVQVGIIPHRQDIP